MSKITRQTAVLFGSSAGVDQIAQFGSLAEGSPVYTTNIATIQGLANYLEGWFGAVIGENSPAIEDMNALCYLFSYQIAYVLEMGVPEYDAGTTYYTNSLVSYNGVVYQSSVDSNLGNTPTGSGTYWWVYGGKFRTVTGNTGVVVSDNVVRVGSGATGNVNVTLPDATTCPGQSFTIKKSGGMAYSVIVYPYSGQLIDGITASITFDGAVDSGTFFSNGTFFDTI